MLSKKKAEASYQLPPPAYPRAILILCGEAKYFSMLGINPLTVLSDIRGKHEFADFAIGIFGVLHRYSPFCGLTTAW